MPMTIATTPGVFWTPPLPSFRKARTCSGHCPPRITHSACRWPSTPVSAATTAIAWTTSPACRVYAALGRCTRWEFWPAWVFYFPVAVNYLWLTIRYRSFTLPTAANPGIFSGGFVGESKIATLQDLHATNPEFTAEAHLVARVTPAERSA